MKKLFGVMILATLPVACGTTNPNAPEMPATAEATGDASFAASKLGRTAPACTPVNRVVVTEFDRQGGTSYLSVQAFAESIRSATQPPSFCGSPSWSVTPQGRGVRLTASVTRNNAVLEAPRGTYVVTASYPGPVERRLRLDDRLVPLTREAPGGPAVRTLGAMPRPHRRRFLSGPSLL